MERAIIMDKLEEFININNNVDDNITIGYNIILEGPCSDRDDLSIYLMSSFEFESRSLEERKRY